MGSAIYDQYIFNPEEPVEEVISQPTTNIEQLDSYMYENYIFEHIVPDSIPTTNTTTTVTTTIANTNSTFEYIYKNIASYPYNTTITDDNRYLVREYTLDVDKSITVTVDMRTSGIVITKISGDTGYDKTLVKTTLFNGHTQISTSYTTE